MTLRNPPTEPEVPACPSVRPSVTVDRSRASVILPTYNRKDHLNRCLQSLLTCDLEGVRLEVHVVDDGSTDGTDAMLQELNAQLPDRVRMRVHRQQNGGPSAARNRAVAACDTDVVLFVDDDCIPQPGWVRALLETPWEEGIGCAGGRIVAPEQPGWVSRYCRWIGFNEFPPPDGKIRFVNTANCAYLRRAVLEVGGLEDLVSGGGEDQDLAWRVTLLGYGMAYRPDAVILHHHREEFRALARTFWTRGYRGTLKRLLWDYQAPPTPKRLWRETRALLRWCLRLPLVPLDAIRLPRQEVAPRDALSFAFMAWLQEALLMGGKLQCMRRVLAGQQSLERTSRVPEGQVDPSFLRRRNATAGARHELE